MTTQSHDIETDSRLTFREIIRQSVSSKRGKTLWAAFCATVLLSISLPIINILVVYPAFTQVLIKGIEDDAQRLGGFLLPGSLKHSAITSDSLPPSLFADIYKLELDFGLRKMKVFSHTGETLYSTDPSEIGMRNTKPYFLNNVMKGQTYSLLVNKGGVSIEGEQMTLDVVETYIPFMKNGRFLGAFELYFDVTDRKNQLDTLAYFSTAFMVAMAFALVLAVFFTMSKEVAHQKAQARASILKADIERITRHDAKTPLVGVLSGLEYLHNYTDLDDEQKDMVAQIRQAADTGLDLINSSLGLYKMESGTYEYLPVEVDLVSIIRKIETSLTPFTEAKGVTLAITRAGKLLTESDTVIYHTEENLFYSMCSNLMKNAIEASTTGDVVTITINGVDGVKLSIHNPAEVPDQVKLTFFEKYATAGKVDGTGLGTYSARLMATTMGGSINMTSSNKSGTLITITLPQHRA